MTYSLSTDLHEAGRLLAPSRLWRTDELRADRRLAPAGSGVYAIWTEVGVGDGALGEMVRCKDFGLAYIGIAGGVGRGTLRRRIRQHLKGPCASSTLRRALAALLREEIGLEAALTPSGKLRLIGAGEARVSAWLAEHARLSWIEHPDPRALERILLRTLSPPLNVEGASSAMSQALRAARRRLREAARA